MKPKLDLVCEMSPEDAEHANTHRARAKDYALKLNNQMARKHACPMFCLMVGMYLTLMAWNSLTSDISTTETLPCDTIEPVILTSGAAGDRSLPDAVSILVSETDGELYAAVAQTYEGMDKRKAVEFWLKAYNLAGKRFEKARREWEVQEHLSMP